MLQAPGAARPEEPLCLRCLVKDSGEFKGGIIKILTTNFNLKWHKEINLAFGRLGNWLVDLT